MNKTAVVIPTYNASKTIVRLVKEILQTVPSVQVFVVDDSSPDKTSELVKKTFGKEKRVTLLVRKAKNGRGSAVIAGCIEALKDKDISSCIEMDADFFHDPHDLPRLIAGLKKADVVVGSRYAKGSKIEGWLWYRKIFSRIANAWARIVLGVPLTDFTNGYRCYSRRATEVLVEQTYKAKGFIVLSEIAYILHKKGFVFTEIPITVRFNAAYGSNFSLKEIKEAFISIIWLRFVH